MSRPESAFSLELERSMNMQVRITTFEEHLTMSKSIDELDDERRKKAHNLSKWNQDMQIHFAKKRKSAIENKDWEAIEELEKEINEFNEVFFRKQKKMEELENYYEQKDDELRDWLLDYAVKCRERLRIENSEIEKRLLKENLEKRTRNEKSPL